MKYEPNNENLLSIYRLAAIQLPFYDTGHLLGWQSPIGKGSKMTRNLKALGMALAAMLAMSALTASSASALNLTSGNGVYPQHLIGEDVGAEDLYTPSAGAAISCHGESYTAVLNAPATSIEATPEYGNTCRTTNVAHWNVTVTENGCKLKFTWAGNHGTDKDTVTVHVICPVGKFIEIHHYSGTPHGTNVTCTNTVGSQTATGTLNATSETATNDILLHGAVGLITQTHGACSFGFTVNVESVFDASTTIRATSGDRIHIG